MTNIEIICNQDLADGSTSVEHLLELYYAASNSRHILEIGSYKGHSTVALALAARPNKGYVISVDLCDATPEADRVNYWNSLKIYNISPYAMSSKEYLEMKPEMIYDFIFHDADHGDHIIPELITCWSRLSRYGILAVHDFDCLSDKEGFINLISPRSVSVTADDRGRELGVFYK